MATGKKLKTAVPKNGAKKSGRIEKEDEWMQPTLQNFPYLKGMWEEYEPEDSIIVPCAMDDDVFLDHFNMVPKDQTKNAQLRETEKALYIRLKKHDEKTYTVKWCKLIGFGGWLKTVNGETALVSRIILTPHKNSNNSNSSSSKEEKKEDHHIFEHKLGVTTKNGVEKFMKLL